MTRKGTVFVGDLDVQEEKGEAGVVVADELGQGPFEGVAAADRRMRVPFHRRFIHAYQDPRRRRR